MDASTALAAAPNSVGTVEELMPRVARQSQPRDESAAGAAEPVCGSASAGCDSYADVLEHLFAVYEDRHTLTRIGAVTAQACADLQGQIPLHAQPELLERLVRARLDALESDRVAGAGGPRR